MQRVASCSNPRAFPPTIGNTSIALDHRHDEHFAHGIPDGVHSLSCERLQRRRARDSSRHHLARRRRGSHPLDDVSGPRRRPAVPPRSQGSRPSADRYPRRTRPRGWRGDDIPRAAGRSLVVSPRRRRARRRPSSECPTTIFSREPLCARSLFRGATSPRARTPRGPSAATTREDPSSRSIRRI